MQDVTATEFMDEDALAMLSDLQGKSFDNIRIVLDALATDPDAPHDKDWIVQSAGLPADALGRTVWAQISRAINNRFGGKWPIERTWGPDVGLPSKVYYMMPAPMAETWTRLRAEHAERDAQT